MRANLIKLTFAGLISVGAMAWVGAPAYAQAVTYKVDMKPTNEVPPTNSQGSGTAEITFDPATKVVTWTVTYMGLTGPATAGHLHGPAAVGANAGVQVPFGALASPIKGMATLTDAQAADLLAGRMYANIHTAANPGGEIRGQIVK